MNRKDVPISYENDFRAATESKGHWEVAKEIAETAGFKKRNFNTIINIHKSKHDEHRDAHLERLMIGGFSSEERVKAFAKSVREFEEIAEIFKKAERAHQLEEENRTLKELLAGNDGMSVKEIREQFINLHRDWLRLKEKNIRLEKSWVEVLSKKHDLVVGLTKGFKELEPGGALFVGEVAEYAAIIEKHRITHDDCIRILGVVAELKDLGLSNDLIVKRLNQ